ncbi:MULTISPECIES: flagellar basal body protein [Ramlibacter]|uniref:Flagellar basal body protein n=1 Tax=Ramlibacter pinisoli TaxID=2682844 RepID=A0A6N8ISP1_9BURK|nr:MULTISPECIES: flagellar basal body protein [Ramlibacter]MBA2964787.1 flagellar basal body protein [Ramlibacter sp. CGMCC 1.13660]MVQ29752.1 flagellar basal body protein [Ramlibacter pinisoli]
MSGSVEAVTTAVLSVALDAASLRHQAIAANISRAGVQGTTPLALAFESQLDQAREELATAGVLRRDTVAALHPELEPALDAAGQPVLQSVDEQMTQLARNAVHYQALLQGLSRHLGVLALAASEGRK